MCDPESVPEDFTKFTIERVERLEDRLIIRYGGRVFGGVMLDVLEDEISSDIHRGAELIARYHTAETGHPGQVAQCSSAILAAQPGRKSTPIGSSIYGSSSLKTSLPALHVLQALLIEMGVSESVLDFVDFTE